MKNRKNNSLVTPQKQVKIILRILFFLMIFLNLCLLIFKKKIFSYNYKYSSEIISVLSEADIKIYNILSDTLEQNINNNKITIVNILFNDEQKLFLNLKKNKILIDSFGNRVNIIDILINNDLNNVKNNDKNVFDNFLEKILDNNIENFLKSNNVTNIVVNVDKINFKNKNIITNNVGKTLILDEKNNLKNIFTDKTDILQIKQTIIDISKDRKFLKNKKIKSSEYYKTNNNNKSFIGELKNFILVESSKSYEHPFFIILDSREKHIFLTTINGEIFKIINLSSFCYPNNLKLYNEILYISDACSGTINYIESLKYDNEIKTLVQSRELLNITDFEFMDKNNIFIVKNNEDSQMIYDLQNNTAQKVNYDDKIGYITNLVEYNNKIYFFDFSNNVLYYYDIENKTIHLKLNFKLKENTEFNINYFVMNNGRNIYFLNKDLNKVYIYSDDDIKEKNFGNFLNYPRDLKIFRNYFYFLSDNCLQRINFLTNENENIKLSFSKKFEFNILESIKNIDVNIQNSLIEEKVSMTNNKINFIYNNMEFLSNSPSFLFLFKNENDTIKFVNRFSFNTNNNEIVDINYNFDVRYKYMLYGKMYYRDLEDNTDKIKTIYIPLKVDKNNNKGYVINIII